MVDILPAELGGQATQKFAFVGDDVSALDPSAAMIFGSVTSILKVDRRRHDDRGGIDPPGEHHRDPGRR